MSWLGSILGNLGGAILGDVAGGPIGATLGAEAGGTLGGVVSGTPLGQSALHALPGAAIAGAGSELLGPDVLGVLPTGSGVSDVSSLLGLGGSGATTTGTPVSNLSSSFTGAPSSAITVAPLSTGAVDPAAAATTDTGVVDQWWNDPTQQTVGSMIPAATGASTPPVTTGTGTDPANPGWFSNALSDLGISKGQALGAGIAGLGLVKDIAAPQTLKGINPLTSQAGALANQGNQMMSYLQTGTLPPGAQTAINNAVAGAKAAIRSKYAQMGISGSSAETQELNQVDQNAAAQIPTIASQLYSQGLQASQISSSLYQTLLRADTAQQQATGQAIGNVAAALAGVPTIRLPTGQTATVG